MSLRGPAGCRTVMTSLVRSRPLGLFLMLVGCGAGVDFPISGQPDAGSPDAGLWPVPGATTLQFTRSAPSFGPVLSCDLDGGSFVGESFQLTWPQAELSYSLCNAGPTSPISRVGQRVLTATEVVVVDQALRAVARSSAQGPCDGPTYSLAIETPSARQLWVDVGCAALDPWVAVGTQGVEGVISVLEGLSP